MYLWIDLWNKNCGISIYIEWVVLSKWIFPRYNLINILKKMVNKYNIEVLVVGLPKGKYNWKNKQLEKTYIFIEKLKSIFPNKKIDWMDERFTSIEASFILDELWVKNKNWKKDDISAVLILEDYLRLNKV